MSQFISYMGKQLFGEVTKEYGAKKVLSIISHLAFFFLPFVFWADMYFILGEKFFVHSWLSPTIVIIIGIAIFVCLIIGYSVFSHSIRKFWKIFMEKVSDDSISKKERTSIAMSYLHFPTLFCLGPNNHPWVLILAPVILETIGSYSVVTFFITNRGLFNHMLTPIYELIAQILYLPKPSVPTLSLLLFCLLLLSLYVYGHRFLSRIRFCKENQLQVLKSFALAIPTFVLIPVRSIMIVEILFDAVQALRGSRLFRLFYEPFVMSSNISKVIQKAFENTQGKDCIVSKTKYELKTEKEVETLKSDAKRHVKTLSSIFNVMNVKPAKALDIIAKQRAFLYLGFVEKQCAFIGVINYGTVSKVRGALFFFNNRYTGMEFQAIIEKEIDKTREI